MSFTHFYSIALSEGKELKVGEFKNAIFVNIKCTSGNDIILPITFLQKVLDGVTGKKSGVQICSNKSVSLTYHKCFEATTVAVVRCTSEYNCVLLTVADAKIAIEGKQRIVDSIKSYKAGQALKAGALDINTETFMLENSVEDIDEELCSLLSATS